MRTSANELGTLAESNPLTVSESQRSCQSSGGEARFSTGGVDSTLIHEMSSSNRSTISTRRADGSQTYKNSQNHSEEDDPSEGSINCEGLFEGITDSTVKGAIWKLAREELRSSSKVQNALKDADSDVKNTLMDCRSRKLHEELMGGLPKRDSKSAMDPNAVQKTVMDPPLLGVISFSGS